MSSSFTHGLSFIGVPNAAARRYVARGPWLLCSWITGLSIFYVSHTVMHHLWPTIEKLLPASWFAYMYVTTTLTNFLTQLLCNLALLPLYTMGGRGVEWVNQLKSEPSKAWPWLSTDAAEHSRFLATLYRSAWLVPFNMFFVAMVGLGVTAPLVAALGVAGPITFATFPSLSTLAWQLAACALIEDACFYTSHRLLHTPILYKSIHKIHHDYGSVVGSASEHAHPIEFLIGNLLPAIAGSLIFRVHLATTLIFLAMRLAVSVEEHSGFSFQGSPFRMTPFSSLAAGHAWHHSHTVGVFASQFCFFDHLFGTDIAFNAWMDAEDDAKSKGQKGIKAA